MTGVNLRKAFYGKKFDLRYFLLFQNPSTVLFFSVIKSLAICFTSLGTFLGHKRSLAGNGSAHLLYHSTMCWLHKTQNSTVEIFAIKETKLSI